MTGSQDYTVAAPPPGSQHSPASTSSLSSTASLPYTGVNPTPLCGTTTTATGYMGWESPGGTTHFAPPPFHYEAAYSPLNGGESSLCEGARGQHTVHFHVQVGEAVSLQLGEQVQTIQGPATVRMVSMNQEPQLPLPVQAPPGHYVQQIVDENGVLTHFILSQHPGPAAYLPPYANGSTAAAPAALHQNGYGGPPYYASPGGLDPTCAVPPPPPPQPPNTTAYIHPPHLHHHHHHPAAAAYYPPDQQLQPPHQQPPTGLQQPPRHLKSQNQRKRFRDPTMVPCYKGKPSGSSSPSLSVQSTPPQSPAKPRGSGGYSSNRNRRSGSAAVDDSEESGIGIEHEEDQEENGLYLEILSNIRTPRVSDIRDRLALLVWSPPVSEPGDPKFEGLKPIEDSDLEYEVLVSDKGKDGKYRSIFSGPSNDCYLMDLRPNTEYHIRVHALMKSRNLKGGASDTVSFHTKACEPDQPQPPKLTQRSKTSIHLRWNAPADNGASIQQYILECDEGLGHAQHFVPVFEGRLKQHNVARLQPSTLYKFRLAAVNELGRSHWSEVVSYMTQGSPPGQPAPPTAAEISESTIRLLWSKRPCDEEFSLQMEDAKTGHGFLHQYNGPNVEHLVVGLQRNTTYRFKLKAHNENGASTFSTDVSYTTNPGRPGPPPKPQVKGKIRPHGFRVIWSLPSDNGGSVITGYSLELDSGSGWQSLYHGEDTEFQLESLQPGTSYRVRVAAESSGGRSDYSETCFITTEPVCPDAPGPPTLLDKPKAMSLHLTWSPPENDGGAKVTEYEIDMTSPDNTTRGVFRGRETDCVVASLLPGRPYLFQVRAYNRAGVGPWSPPLEVISGAGPPGKPREPTAVVKSATALKVSWDQPINNGAIISSYRLELACITLHQPELESDTDDDDEEEEEEEIVEEEAIKEEEYDDEDSEEEEALEKQKKPPAQTEQPQLPTNCDSQPLTKGTVAASQEEAATVENPEEREKPMLAEPELEWRLAYSGSDRATDLRDLSPATEYELRVCAINSAGASPFSGSVRLRMPASVPGPVAAITPLDATATSLCFKFKKPASHGERIEEYNVEWTDKTEKEPKQMIVKKRKTTICDLRPDTTYTVRVQAVNSVGRGGFSPALRLATRPLPPAPPRLECVSASHNTLKLKWADGKTSLPGTSYILETENSRKAWFPLYNGAAHSFRHSKLNENTEYRYRISAATEAGQGPASQPIIFKTTFAPPPPIKIAPRVSNITESGCLVQWSTIKGEHLNYRIQVTRARDGDCRTVSAGADSQFRIDSLEAKSEYTVRICAVRTVGGQPDSSPLLGPFSPPTSFSTIQKSGAVASPPVIGVQDVAKASKEKIWSDQQWAVVILLGFTLFAVFVAMIIQQLISLGTLSS